LEHPDEPTLSLDREALQFGGEFGQGAYVGTSVQQSLLLQNKGLNKLVIERVEQAGAPVFTLEMPPSLEVEPLGHTFLRVFFAPTDNVAYEGSLTIHSNAVNAPVKTIALTGTGIAP
jgi:hypothetical protein